MQRPEEQYKFPTPEKTNQRLTTQQYNKNEGIIFTIRDAPHFREKSQLFIEFENTSSDISFLHTPRYKWMKYLYFVKKISLEMYLKSPGCFKSSLRSLWPLVRVKTFLKYMLHEYFSLRCSVIEFNSAS